MRVEAYQPDRHREIWEAFVSGRARNGHFMHTRRYLEYHGDRFEDCSLLFFEDGAAPVALLPAHRSEKMMVSHGGLSFGGILVSDEFRFGSWGEVFLALGGHLRMDGFEALDYRPTPPWFQPTTGEEDVYLIEAAGVKPTVLASAICRIGDAIPPNSTRRNEARSAARSGVGVDRDNDALRELMGLVATTLQLRHGAGTVHTVDEMEDLAQRFPDEIRAYVARDSGGALIAGAVVFCSPSAVKLQYVGYRTAPAGSYAMSAVYAHLFGLEELCGRWFDFGTSMADGELDAGLFAYKESLGGRLAPVRRYILAADVPPLSPC